MPNDKNNSGSAYPFLFRVLHWLLPISAVVLILTGYSLHAVSRPDWSLFKGVLPTWFWPGRVNLWHLVAALVFLPSMLGTLWTCWRPRLWHRPNQVVLIGSGMLMVASGLLMLNWFGAPAVRSCAEWIHTAFGLMILPAAFLWHALTGLTRDIRKLVPSFNPFYKLQLLPVVAFVILAGATTCLVLNDLPVHPTWRDLVAKRIDAGDGEVTDLASLPWDETRPLHVHLAGGIGYWAGQTGVALRAMHDDQNLYVRAVWLDPVEQREYMPYRKTADGWKHLAAGSTGGAGLDERYNYEDKFSLIFPITPDWQFDRFGCAASCHVGGGRAYGYKGTNRTIDVWHWKATRTDPVGQVDDKYWSEVDFEAKDIGRHGDPKESGGYKKNFSEDKTHPAYLPSDMAVVRQGIIPKEHAVEYTDEAAAAIVAETIIPGIVASPAVGDRGDVLCRSHHANGRWTLYIRRKLDTGSEYDAKFVAGGLHPFACAAFDHSSKRHAYNLLTYRLVLEE